MPNRTGSRPRNDQIRQNLIGAYGGKYTTVLFATEFDRFKRDPDQPAMRDDQFHTKCPACGHEQSLQEMFVEPVGDATGSAYYCARCETPVVGINAIFYWDSEPVYRSIATTPDGRPFSMVADGPLWITRDDGINVWVFEPKSG